MPVWGGLGLFAVLFGVMLRRFFGVVRGVQVVAARDVRVMGGLFVVPGFVMRGGVAMVRGRFFVMLGGEFVVFCAFVGHGNTPILAGREC